MEERLTSDTALFRTLSSSVTWMEFICIMTSASFQPPQLRVRHPYLQLHPPESYMLELIFSQDAAHVKPCHMKSEPGILRIAALFSVVIDSLGPQPYLASQLILCMIFHPFPNLVSPIFPEKRIQTLRGHSLMPVSLLLDTELSVCLEFYLLFSASHLQSPLSPHLIYPLLFTLLHMQYVLLDLSGLQTSVAALLSFVTFGLPKFHQLTVTSCLPRYSGPTSLTSPLFIVPCLPFFWAGLFSQC